MSKTATTVDPFTVEVIKEGLVAVAEEMFISLGRTSKSTIIYEVLDYACGIIDQNAAMIAQANGVPAFAGVLTYTVESVIEKFGLDGLEPGDVITTNDPYSGGGTHLSDVAMVLPIFVDGQLVAFAANKAHWTEVGGKDPGSWTTDATEIYQEGLQFPAIKLFVRGEPVSSVMDIIEANVRLPDMTLGDLHAQAASLRVAARRFEELCAKYGLATVQQSIEIFLQQGEQLALLALKELPNGVYEAVDYIDDDGLGSDPIEVRVKVMIGDEAFVVDFTGSGQQAAGPINCTRTGLYSGMRTIFKALTTPHEHVNEGSFKPLEVICPDATVFTAVRPAPVSTYWETLIYAIDLTWKALAPILPHRLPAGHFLSVCGIVLAGMHPDTGELTLLVEPQAGGWGAGQAKDGESGIVCVGDGDTMLIPIEVCEARYPVIVDRFCFDTIPAGAGRQRGGFGLVREYRVIAESGATLTGTFGRHIFPPWGIAGGQDGSPNYIEIVHADGRPTERYGKVARYPLAKGDVARLVTGAGGGWGSPSERSPELVAADLQAGLIDEETARQTYGFSGDTGSA